MAVITVFWVETLRMHPSLVTCTTMSICAGSISNHYHILPLQLHIWHGS